MARLRGRRHARGRDRQVPIVPDGAGGQDPTRHLDDVAHRLPVPCRSRAAACSCSEVTVSSPVRMASMACTAAANSCTVVMSGMSAALEAARIAYPSARAACPVGAEYRYPPAQLRFHMAALGV